MNRHTILFLLLALAAAARAQVSVDVRVDSLDRFVGQQAGVTLEVTADSKAKVTMPEYAPGQFIVDDLELVEASGTDTTKLNEGSRQTLTRTYTLTSFTDSTRIYRLPPFIVTVDGKQYPSKELNLRYETIEVDTIHADQFYGIKDVIQPELTWEDWKPVAWIMSIVLILAGMASYLMHRYKTGQPLVNINFRREKKLLPHQVALAEINRIKTERKWAEEDSKEYYTLLTDALRTYIAERYGFNAKEMTSAEIIEHLLNETDEERMRELRQLFTTADLVKFAKAQTMINENDMNLVNAIEFIQETKLEPDPNAAPEPDPEMEVKRRGEKQRLALLGVVIALSVAAFALMAYAGWICYKLLV